MCMCTIIQPSASVIFGASFSLYNFYKHFQYVLTSFLHLSIEIFTHSSHAKASSLLMCDGLRAATAFFKSHQRFSMGFKSGQRRPLQDIPGLGSLSCWRIQWSPRFNFPTEGIKFPFKMAWYFWESTVPGTQSRLPVPAAEKHPHIISGPHTCLSMGMVFFWP